MPLAPRRRGGIRAPRPGRGQANDTEEMGSLNACQWPSSSRSSLGQVPRGRIWPPTGGGEACGPHCGSGAVSCRTDRTRSLRDGRGTRTSGASGTSFRPALPGASLLPAGHCHGASEHAAMPLGQRGTGSPRTKISSPLGLSPAAHRRSWFDSPGPAAAAARRASHFAWQVARATCGRRRRRAAPAPLSPPRLPSSPRRRRCTPPAWHPA